MTLQPLKTLFVLISLLFIQFTGNAVHAETITGTLDSVIDGDTLTMISKGKVVEIRLFGIDSPEKTQLFGQIARNFTGGKAAKGEIRAETVTKTKDHDGRIVALVFVNGINLNEQIVSQGFGWVYRQYCKESFCADWLKLEADAKAAQKGLWADAKPTPPWEYRQNQLSGSHGRALGLAALPTVSGKSVPGVSAAYHGNTVKHVFHSAACKEFKCPTCTENFNSISEALDAGYRPHLECLTK